MKAIIALLIALALMIVPALAFTPTIPYSTIESQTESMVKDTGTYSYERYVVDEDNIFTPQNTDSGLLFGAAEGPDSTFAVGTNPGPEGWTAGVVGNVIETDADGVTSDITRQYIQQGGSAYVTLKPGNLAYDPEYQVPPEITVDMGFSKSNLAWVSGDLTEFTVSPDSYAAVGGNFLEAVPLELSPYCQNAWLVEREAQAPITISAEGAETRLLDAYAGTASRARLTMTPAVGEDDYNDDGTLVGTYIPAAAKMSGYAERFAGYDDAWVNKYDDVYVPNSYVPPPSGPNKILINFGEDADNNLVEHFWIAEAGIDFDAPEFEDFPQSGDGITPGGQITWPDEGLDGFDI